MEEAPFGRESDPAAEERAGAIERELAELANSRVWWGLNASVARRKAHRLPLFRPQREIEQVQVAGGTGPSAATTSERGPPAGVRHPGRLKQEARGQGGGPQRRNPAKRTLLRGGSVTQDDIAEVIAKWTRHPRWLAALCKRVELAEPAASAEKRGELATSRVDRASSRRPGGGQMRFSLRAGYQDPNRPIASFLLSWTHGRGRRNSAKPWPPRMFDTATTPWCASTMSEYMRSTLCSMPPDRAPTRYVVTKEGGPASPKPCAAGPMR